jgi:hypothetical protein
MHKLPRGNEYGVGRTWLPYRVNRQANIKLPPSDYLRKLSFHTVFLDQERIITRDRANCEIGRDHRLKWIYVTKRFQSQKSSQFYSEWRSGSADLIGDDRECLGRAPRHRDRKALACKASGRGSAQSSARADANHPRNGFVYGHSINHCLVPKP